MGVQVAFFLLFSCRCAREENCKGLSPLLILPQNVFVVRHEENRPQPRRDRETEKGMACVIGRLRPCNVFDIKFVSLSHNTKRGAALGGILNAELLKAKGFFDNL